MPDAPNLTRNGSGSALFKISLQVIFPHLGCDLTNFPAFPQFNA